MVITSKTKNGVSLYFEVNEDVSPNEGGYYCDVYLDEDCTFVYDSFDIKKKDLDVLEQEFGFMKFAYIQQRCDNYAKNFDDMSVINSEFNEVYEAISNAYSMLNDFYTKYVPIKEINRSNVYFLIIFFKSCIRNHHSLFS